MERSSPWSLLIFATSLGGEKPSCGWAGPRDCLATPPFALGFALWVDGTFAIDGSFMFVDGSGEVKVMKIPLNVEHLIWDRKLQPHGLPGVRAHLKHTPNQRSCSPEWGGPLPSMWNMLVAEDSGPLNPGCLYFILFYFIFRYNIDELLKN